MEEKWLTWAKSLQSIAQAGLTYSTDKYDRERFEQIRDLSVQIMMEYTEAGEKTVRDIFCAETGYQTPKVDVRGAVFKENKVLLVKESIDGCWSMPGGWADIGLTIKENVEKEAKEEAGLLVEAKRLVGVFDWVKVMDRPSPFAIYKVVMLCDAVGGTFEKNIETEDADYFPLDALPELSHGRTTKSLIDLCYRALENPGFVPIID